MQEGSEPERGARGASEPRSGDRFGAYRLVRYLARGGQGEVWLALDGRLDDRPVALKFLLGTLSLDARTRFEREAAVLGKLRHRGICTVYEFGAVDGRPFIAMEYVEGMSLAQRLEQPLPLSRSNEDWLGLESTTEIDAHDRGRTARFVPGPLRPTLPVGEALMDAAGLVAEVARALHVVHEAGLVHRDVKPGNIMLRPEGTPVLVDFGLAWDVDQRATRAEIGRLLGTKRYLSPEHLLTQHVPMDRRSDVYALGITLFECATLRRPFEQSEEIPLLTAINEGDFPAPRSINRAISEDLEAVILKAMAREPRKRYETAEQFADDLDRLRRRFPVRARPAGRRRRLQLWWERNPALALTTMTTSVLGLLAVIGLIVSTQLRGARDRAETSFERVADVIRLRTALAEAHEPVPLGPEPIALFERWLARYRDLPLRLPDYERELARLRGKALPYDDVDRARDHGQAVAERVRLDEWLDELANRADEADQSESGRLKKISGMVETRIEELEDLIATRTYRFGPNDGPTAFMADVLGRLIDDLRRFAEPATGTIARVEARLAQSRAIRDTCAAHASRWDGTRARIRTSERYGGLDIARQSGLVPLGPDPVSGLEEFLDVATHVGPVPVRQAGCSIAVGPDTGLVLVLLPARRFLMGSQSTLAGVANFDPETSDNEGPVHAVRLDPFFISKFEMTQGQWSRATGANPSYWSPDYFQGKDDARADDLARPVDEVSWDDCQEALPWLRLMLPTEAQWEYAARSGTETPRPWKERLDQFANLADLALARGSPRVAHDPDLDDGSLMSAPVGGARQPNAFGLYDVIGNVWEWCRDVHRRYEDEIMDRDGTRFCPTPTAADHRSLRGGSYWELPRGARSATRKGLPPVSRNQNVGVRPARRIEP